MSVLRLFRPLVALLAVLLVLSPIETSLAQSAPAAEGNRVTVGYFVNPPFVMKSGDTLSGMAVDLWQKLASTGSLASDYREFPTIRALLDATARGEVDVAVANLTITRDRAERVDFSHPWFDSGLRLMIKGSPQPDFWEMMFGLKDMGHLRVYLGLAAIIFAATVLLTLFDRRFDKEFPRSWTHGLAESFHAVVGVAMTGRVVRRNVLGALGRLMAALWMIVGVAVIAYITSSVTSVMTAISIENQIDDASELGGRVVGVFSGSIAEDYARSENLRMLAFPGIDAAASALHAERVDAVIADAPVLEYYVHSHPESGFDVIGAIFDPEKYGFAFPPGSPLLRPITIDLLAAHEDGSLEALRNSYFGEHQ
jgi:ABC-type amino acid transport substrate-binding protein